MTHRDHEVLAAGGVVLRRSAKGRWKVLVVHRPGHRDWSLPKGKLDAGEHFETAALREVEEETGVRCELGPELSHVTYGDGNGRHKLVRYWVMRPVDGHPRERAGDDEVDEACWVPVSDARELLTYDDDWFLIEQALGKVET